MRQAGDSAEDAEFADLVEAALEGAAECAADLQREARSNHPIPHTPPGIPGVRILREIGRGGMGVVYEAEQESPRRRVVVKLLYRGHGAAHEAQMMADALQHAPDGICQVYGMGEVDGRPYLVTQYIEGTSLASVLRSRETAATSGEATSEAFFFDTNSPLESFTQSDPTMAVPSARRDVAGAIPDRAAIDKAVSLIERAARSLHWVHEAGVIHGDIKPANIMVTPDGRPVVIDFGVAAPAREHVSYGGTPTYMAPEQRKGLDIDRRVDVFALGLILYRMLTGRTPQGPLRMSGPKPPPLQQVNRHVSRDLPAVCHKAIELDPARRYATALELADDLAAAASRRPTRALPSGPARRLVLAIRRHPAAAAAVFLAIVVGGGYGIGASLDKEAVIEETRESRAKLELKTTALNRFLEARQEGREPSPEDDAVARSELDPDIYDLFRENPGSRQAMQEYRRTIEKWVAETRSGASSWVYPTGRLRVGSPFTIRISNLRTDRVPDAPVTIRFGVLSDDFLHIDWRHEFEARPVIAGGIASIRVPPSVRLAPDKGESVYLWRWSVPVRHGGVWESGDLYLRCVAPGFLDGLVARKAPGLDAFPEPLRTTLKAATLLELDAPAAALDVLEGLEDAEFTPPVRRLTHWTRLRALEHVDRQRAAALLEENPDDR